ncbi:DDE-domain-containing protein, partial [Schizophyllum commune Tattone D]
MTRQRCPPPPRNGKRTTQDDQEARYAQACALLRTPAFRHPGGRPKFKEAVKVINSRQPKDRSRHVFIKVGTLRSRFEKSHQPAHAAHGAQQAVKPDAEKALLTWLHFASERGDPADKPKIAALATSLAGYPVGKNWVDCFLKRHEKRLCFARTLNLDPKRARAFNPTTVKQHYELYEGIIKSRGVKPRNAYNLDEQGMQKGGGKKSGRRKFAMPPSMRGKQYKLSSENLELTTVMEAICVEPDGSPAPMFIHSGEDFDLEEAEVGCQIDPRITLANSQKGWTDDDLFAEYLRKCFIPHATARRESPDDPILLIMDGHKSHETYEVLRLARENNIILYSLPAHTTHKLQPLDVGVFGTFKTKWRDEVRKYIQVYKHDMPRADFLRMYMTIRQEVFSPTVIEAAFRDTGLWPFNP